jgi:glycolate oxidase
MSFTLGPSDDLIVRLEQIVSPQFVSNNVFEMIKNTLDAMPYDVEREQLAVAVAMPGSAEEISEILRLANDRKIPVFIRGSGTQLAGSSRPHAPGIIINTHRLNQFEFFEEDGFFECGPGCICADIQAELEKRNYFLPMAPGSRIIASIGGLVSNNTSGHLIDTCLGKPGDYVLGLEAVLPNGDVIETGTKGLRRPAGTDLTKFFVGGDGLLGVITRIRIRLIPEVRKAFGFAVYENLSSLARGVQRMYYEKRPIPLFMEFMDKQTSKLAYEIKGMTPPEGSVIFFVSIGSSEKEASKRLLDVFRSFEAENPLLVQSIEDPETWEKLWSARELIGSYIQQQMKSYSISAEVVSSLRRLVECMEDSMNFSKGLPVLSELPFFLLGHIGALTMHPVMALPKEWSNEKRRQAMKEKFEKETELNLKYGTCGGEWGQFSKRKDFFVKRYGEAAYRMIGALKHALDPNNILNTGVLEGYR